MSYELKDYLREINTDKNPVMDSDDEMWEKKYPPFIVNKCLAPFPDSIHAAAEAGIAAIIQPGGSRGDEAVIEACNEHGIPMIFTGRRHFKH